MESSAIARALRELSRLDAFDYVPPFRGKAVHILNRHRAFEQLEIDLTTLEKRKEAEFTKLARMIRYARSQRCRQWEVLQYFGQTNPEDCGTCDNCLKPRSPTKGSASVSVESADTSVEPRKPVTR